MAKSKLLSSIVLGALAGAAISMLDRTTREHTIATTKKTVETVSYYATNREELQTIIEDKIEQAQSIYNGASDSIQSFISQAEQFDGMPETLQAMLQNTKTAFDKNDSTSN